MDSDPTAASPGLFEAVGVTREHEAVYRFVLARRVTTATDVEDAFGATPGVARAELETLRSRGLISRSGTGDGYFAVDPRVAVRALAERSASHLDLLRAAIPSLAGAYERVQSDEGPHPRILVVSGASSVGAWYGRLEQQTTTEFLAFDRPPYVLAPHNPVQQSVLERGVSWRAVYAAASLERPGGWEEIRSAVRRGERARLAADLPVKLAISDRRIAIFSSSFDLHRPEAVVTEAPPVVEMLAGLFEAAWEKAVDVPADDVSPEFGRTRGPSAEERAMLALFAAGARDEVIARELGMSPRTLRRRSNQLLQHLGAANRFTAGMRAVQLGWI